MLPCFAQVVVAATMTIGAAGGTAENCFLEVIGYPADGHTVQIQAFDYAPPGTVRTIWWGDGTALLNASPTPGVVHYIGLPNALSMIAEGIDVMTFMSVGTFYGPQSQSAWILTSMTRYQSPGEIPGASRGLTITQTGPATLTLSAQDVVLCDLGEHCVQQQSPRVSINLWQGVGIGGVDATLVPGTWYLYILESLQGPGALASQSPTAPILPPSTNSQDNYAFFAPVGVATIDVSGEITSVAPLPAR